MVNKTLCLKWFRGKLIIIYLKKKKLDADQITENNRLPNVTSATKTQIQIK